jgi:hypothetical protein
MSPSSECGQRQRTVALISAGTVMKTPRDSSYLPPVDTCCRLCIDFQPVGDGPIRCHTIWDRKRQCGFDWIKVTVSNQRVSLIDQIEHSADDDRYEE